MSFVQSVAAELTFESTLDINAARNAANISPRKPDGSNRLISAGTAVSPLSRSGRIKTAASPGRTTRNGMNILRNPANRTPAFASHSDLAPSALCTTA